MCHNRTKRLKNIFLESIFILKQNKIKGFLKYKFFVGSFLTQRGLKTGSTGKALYCLSGTAEKNGLKLIGVVMAAPDHKIRFQEVMKMFDYGFTNYGIMKGLPIGDTIGEVPVVKGETETAELVIAKEISFLAQKGQEGELTQEIELIPSIQAPVAEGTKGGEVIYKINGKEVGRTDAITKDTIEKVSLGTMLQRLMEKWY